MQIIKDIVQCLDTHKSADIKIYDTRNITPFYDYVVNCTVSNSRQLGAVVRHLEDMSAEKGYPIKGVEGLNGGYWALVDLRDALVNVFLKDERKKYDLDKLWQDLPQIPYESCL
ncbi:MAG: ribosome silencing factor [Acholeplasmataceae bacterium]|nr:ribosome silencing factor [Acholeplasmataceae bacterium]